MEDSLFTHFILQHSDPCSMVANTQLSYTFSLVNHLYICDLHTLLSIFKAYLALSLGFWISIFASPLVLTMLVM